MQLVVKTQAYLYVLLFCCIIGKTRRVIDDWSCIGWSTELDIPQGILVCFYHATNSKAVWIMRVAIECKLMGNLGYKKSFEVQTA